MRKTSLKHFVSSFPLFDVLTLIFSLLLIFAPISTVTVIIRAIGITAAAYALWRIALTIFIYERAFATTILTVSYVLLFVFGLILLINPKGALAFLSAAVGIFLVAEGGIKLFRAAAHGSGRMLFSRISAILTIVLGCLLLFFPSGGAKISAILIGASLLFESSSNIIIGYMPKRTKRDPTYIEADFIDKSDEL